MAQQFFIPTAKHLVTVNEQESTDVYADMQQAALSASNEREEAVYVMSYIDSNNDEILYRVGEEHPHKNMLILAILKVSDIFYVFSDEKVLRPERLNFSGRALHKLQLFDH